MGNKTLMGDGTLTFKQRPPKIPPAIKDGIDRYVEGGYSPGGFLMGVLQNDLISAVLRADDQSLKALPEIMRYIWNHIPSGCWGSEKKMSEWSDKKAGEWKRSLEK